GLHCIRRGAPSAIKAHQGASRWILPAIVAPAEIRRPQRCPMRQTSVLFALLALLPCVARAEGPGGVKPSFTWPLPEGWKTETIPLPLEFAPDVRHTGWW